MASIVKNVGALSGARIVVVLLQFLALPLIARYLTTAEFGVVALAMSVVVFCQTLSDAGLGRSLIRQPHYDRGEWSTVLWFLAAVGLGLGAVIFFSAGALAAAFGAPDLGALLQVLALMPLLYAMAAVPTAYLEKHGRFSSIAIVKLAAALIGLGAAVGLAVAGAGAWALVTQQICIAGIELLGIWLLSGFRPKARFAVAELKRHFTFARDNIGVSLLMTAQRQVPVMVTGYVLGSAALGLYAMGQRLLRLPLMGFGGPFCQVAYVRMTPVQDQPEQVGKIYVATVRIMGLVVLPPMLLLAAVGEQAFAILFSETWRQAGLIYALAAPGIALEVATSAAGVAFQATGRTGLRLRMATERAVLRTLALVVAIPFGLEALAGMITIFAILYLHRYWSYLRQAVTFSQAQTLVALAPTALATTAGVVTLLLAVPPELGVGAFLMSLLATLAASWLLAGVLQFGALRQALKILG